MPLLYLWRIQYSITAIYDIYFQIGTKKYDREWQVYILFCWDEIPEEAWA